MTVSTVAKLARTALCEMRCSRLFAAATLAMTIAWGCDRRIPPFGATDAGGSVDVVVFSEESGSEYWQGSNKCCARGDGNNCCGDQTRQIPRTCFEYGGVYGDCRKAGEFFEGKVICAKCCPGLRAVSSTDYTRPEHCDVQVPFSILICLKCGDGVCDGEFENDCNCREDCLDSDGGIRD